MGTLKTTNIQTITGSGTLTLGTSGETVALGSGVTVTGNGLVGITEADMFRLTADLTANANPISSNIERVDDASFSKIGTGVTVSSGTFSFAKTGIYLVIFNSLASGSTANDNIFLDLKGTTDNSSYDVLATGAGGLFGGGSVISTMFCQTYFDVTDITTHKIQFELSSLQSGNLIRGHTDKNETTFTFIRLGDT